MLETLPDDIYRFGIMPYLDYTSRLNLNLVLPKNYQIVQRFDKSEILSHEIHILVKLVKTLFDKADNETNRNKKLIIYGNIFTLVSKPRFRILLTNYSIFRTAYTERLKYFSNGMVIYRRDAVTKKNALNMGRICRKILASLDNMEISDIRYISKSIVIV